MIRLLFIIVAMFLSVGSVTAGRNTRRWMSGLDDARMVCKVSIPGTHDTMTAEGFVDTEHTDDYTTQVAGLRQQLDGGLRYFDIRLMFNTDERGDTILQTCHRTALIRKTFADVLSVLETFLRENHSEFVIIKIQYDGGRMDEAQNRKWCRLVRQAVAAHLELFADFRPDVTVGEVRGRVLMLSRTDYGEPVVGALTGWGNQGSDDYKVFELEKECTYSLRNGNATAPLYVQDYYNSIADRMPRKLEAIEAMYRKAQEIPADSVVWILSHTSGFSSPKMNALGYAENAARSNNLLMELLQCKDDSRPVGIVAMDYACIDRLNRKIGTLGRIKRKVNAKTLTRKVIDRNFK